jgi:D-methionine transport system substrate-binding protein
VEVTPIDASQTAGALQSGSAAAAVVNVNFATSAGLPAGDVIAQDDPADPGAAPYVNIFASRSADSADPTYLALAELWHDPRVLELFAQGYPTAVVVEKSTEELQSDLAAVEQDAAAAAG